MLVSSLFTGGALTAGIDPKPCALVLLMPGSLLIFNQDAYERCLHGIDEVQQCHVAPLQFTAHADIHRTL